MFTNQSMSNELIIGSQAEFTLENIKIIPFTYYRVKDLIIIGFGMMKDNLTTNISYDVNISDLDIKFQIIEVDLNFLSYIYGKKEKNVLIKLLKKYVQNFCKNISNFDTLSFVVSRS